MEIFPPGAYLPSDGSMPDPKTHPNDVGKIIAQLNRQFQPEGPRIPGDPRYENAPTRATPRAMHMLVSELRRKTEEAKERVSQYGLADVIWHGPFVQILDPANDDPALAQFRSDMATWEERLAAYERVLDEVAPMRPQDLFSGDPRPELDSDEAADRIYFLVTAPLLDGVWYAPLPGVSFNAEELERMKTAEPPFNFSNDKPPDAYTPSTLGNQIAVYKTAQQENYRKFVTDLRDNLKKLPQTLVPDLPDDPGKTLRWAVISVVATLGGAFAGGALATIGLNAYNRRQARRRAFAPNPRAEQLSLPLAR